MCRAYGQSSPVTVGTGLSRLYGRINSVLLFDELLGDERFLSSVNAIEIKSRG